MIHLEAASLSKRYGSNLVFRDLSFATSVSVVGIAGQNGSGKSTLLKCISGLIKPTSGRILWRIDGNEESPEAIRPMLGYAAPYIQLYEELTVHENLTFISALRQEDRNKEIAHYIKFLQAETFEHSFFGELSTGQQQRAKLAAALIHKPRILILDEPGSNLDKRGNQNVSELTDRFRSSNNLLILASNQKKELDLCDQIIDLNQKELHVHS